MHASGTGSKFEPHLAEQSNTHICMNQDLSARERQEADSRLRRDLALQWKTTHFPILATVLNGSIISSFSSIYSKIRYLWTKTKVFCATNSYVQLWCQKNESFTWQQLTNAISIFWLIVSCFILLYMHNMNIFKYSGFHRKHVWGDTPGHVIPSCQASKS